MRKGARFPARNRIETQVKRNFFEALVAVLAGNALYFVLLTPHLPPVARHAVGQIDLGLGVDFVLCGALYLLLRRLDRPPSKGEDRVK